MIRVSFLTIMLYRKNNNKKITIGGHQHYHHLSSFRVSRVVRPIKMIQLAKMISNSEKNCVETQSLVSYYQVLRTKIF